MSKTLEVVAMGLILEAKVKVEVSDQGEADLDLSQSKEEMTGQL